MVAKADKDDAAATQDTNYYINKPGRQLNNTIFYQILSKDLL